MPTKITIAAPPSEPEIVTETELSDIMASGAEFTERCNYALNKPDTSADLHIGANGQRIVIVLRHATPTPGVLSELQGILSQERARQALKADKAAPPITSSKSDYEP